MNTHEIDYWNNFYKNFSNTQASSFATFVLDYFKNYTSIHNVIDLGCGNGRDSYLLSTKYKTTGIDISNKPIDSPNTLFILGDMILHDKSNYELLYSRFTFHSLTDFQQEELIKSIHQNAYLCIETRSSKGIDSFRLFGDTHFRNFTSLDTLLILLNKYNFEVLYKIESNGLAIYQNEDPICIRVICKKR
jgi:tellurite methyltransferase